MALDAKKDKKLDELQSVDEKLIITRRVTISETRY